jgi:hypothetical protein
MDRATSPSAGSRKLEPRTTADQLQQAKLELRKVYTPEGADIWLTSSHKLLGGEVPMSLIERGEAAQVFTVIAQLVETAYA